MSVSFSSVPFPYDAKSVSAIPYVKREVRSVFACIARNTNGNIVVMEATRARGIELYWLDLEPSYKASARKKGRNHDRDTFAYLDHVAYGYTLVYSTADSYTIRMKQMPQHLVNIRLEADGVTRAFVDYEHDTYLLDFIYVNYRNPASCDVNVYVIDPKTGKRRTIKVN
jgi:hypothetical protein